jgi:hypothetical protein
MSIIAAIATRTWGRSSGGSGSSGGGESSIAGVGSVDLSLSLHPPTGPVTTGDIWVDPTAGTNGDGSEGSPYNSLSSALSAVSDGERIIVRAGTIALSNQISRNTTWATGIEVFAYGDERPIIDASGLGGTSRALYFTGGSKEHWKGFEFKDGPDRGIDIASTNTTIEDVWVHGFQKEAIYIANFGSGAGNNKILDFAIWKLGDGVSGGTNVPDGIALTGNTGSPTEGNVLARGFVANAVDDGVDLFRARNTRVYSVVTYKTGYYWNGDRAGVEVDGETLPVGEQDPSDGNGFKLGGGDSDSGDNYAIGCLSLLNAASGFSHNEARNTPTESDPNVVVAFATAHGNGGSGVNIGGDQAAHLNVRRDCIITSNGSVGYVGANADNLRDITTGVTYADAAGGDYSLAVGGNGIGDGIEEGIGNSVSTQPTTGTATNAGASVTALELALEWIAKDLTA